MTKVFLYRLGRNGNRRSGSQGCPWKGHVKRATPGAIQALTRHFINYDLCINSTIFRGIRTDLYVSPSSEPGRGTVLSGDGGSYADSGGFGRDCNT